VLLSTLLIAASTMSYDNAYERAIHEQKPLVVFVGLPEKEVDWAVVCRVDELEGYTGPTIVVSEPSEGKLYWKATLGSDYSALRKPEGATDALDEVNARRAGRGLPAFVRDEGLTVAAKGAAQYRAAYLMFGHTSNDFSFVPSGTTATSAGCAAYEPGYGWMSCCMDDNYTYAGAAWAMGSDGKRYMHLFVR
jgi:hypothetical protein